MLLGGLELHIAEYVITAPILTRPKYRYHLQTFEGKQIRRWDNAPHHPDVSTFPHHFHDERNKVHPVEPMSIPDVLEAVLEFIVPTQD